MIKINKIQKSYGGKTVIKNLNLHLNKSMIYALLGKNGVGKSTLINIIMDIIPACSGEVLINGVEQNKITKDQKSRIGFIGENLALIEELSGFDFLKFIGKIYGIDNNVIKKRINDLSSYFFDNNTDINKSISAYSTGMRKKIAFCAAVIHTPEILILDEPFSGLDPLVANQMIAFLQQYKSDERLIFISSHDLNYVEKIATHIGVLDNEELVFNASMEDFTQNGINSLDSALLQMLKPNDSELSKIDWL